MKVFNTDEINSGGERIWTNITIVEEMERKGLVLEAKPYSRASSTPLSPRIVESYYENEFMDAMRSCQAQEDDEYFKMEEYSRDIYWYLRELEQKNRAKTEYMNKQPDISASMRSTMVDWLVDMAEEYNLHTETLYLTVNYVDRFLSYMSVVRSKFQLVGTAAMFLASKYEEIYPPKIGEFIYTKHQIIRMQYLIVKVLNFDLNCTTPLTFINTICTTNKLEDKQKYFAMYLCELSMLEVEAFLEFLPSQLACAAIVIGRLHLVGPKLAWSEDLQQYTGYKLQTLENPIRAVDTSLVTASSMSFSSKEGFMMEALLQDHCSFYTVEKHRIPALTYPHCELAQSVVQPQEIWRQKKYKSLPRGANCDATQAVARILAI
ncbi:unnamed protein product [Ceutorhynchus assimilis]|uniref:Cyclin A n=1 Tax=Ceutorhynchus assimilis TaxID=467358 RepID=A0A9N9MDY3_9CUCU|nr:unnamed protein product [Ceutorhynchus assimilis]